MGGRRRPTCENHSPLMQTPKPNDDVPVSMRKFRALSSLVILSAASWLSVLAIQIVDYGRIVEPQKADVAIVLGAAVYADRPSPVFEERIRHGIILHRKGVVRKLLFTGGYGDGARWAEADVAKRVALERGIPSQAILTETKSRTTRENLLEARSLMRNHGIETAIIVSDPLHLKRAIKMAGDLGIDASAAPTPTSRYRTWRTKIGFLLREVYFYNHYLLTGK